MTETMHLVSIFQPYTMFKVRRQRQCSSPHRLQRSSAHTGIFFIPFPFPFSFSFSFSSLFSNRRASPSHSHCCHGGRRGCSSSCCCRLRSLQHPLLFLLLLQHLNPLAINNAACLNCKPRQLSSTHVHTGLFGFLVSPQKVSPSPHQCLYHRWAVLYARQHQWRMSLTIEAVHE